jgi:hypothetical protein
MKTRIFVNVIFMLVLTVCSAGEVCAATINVPADYLTISAAITAATSGDTIQIAAGNHNESGINVTKQLIIQGESADTTIIDGGATDSVFIVTGNNTIVISDMTIQNGKATDPSPGDRGGGILNYNENLVVRNCIFNGNSAAYGGGIYSELSSSGPDVFNCLFTGNEATGSAGGAGMRNKDCSPNVINCTFVNNTGKAFTVGWGGDPKITNCIFWDNTGGEIIAASPASVTVNYTGVPGGHAGTGNIDLTASPLTGDYKLKSDSATYTNPAVNKGNGNPTGLSVDLAGNDRVVNGTIDMGAYERPPDEGVTISTDTINITEGTTVTYTVVLNTLPSVDVVINLTLAGSPGQLELRDSSDNPITSLTFTSTNGTTAQTVKVVALDDYVDDDEAITITHAVAAGSAAEYLTADISPNAVVTVNITDTDTAGVIVAPTSFTISEPTGSDSFNIKLNSQPTANVTISLTQSAAGECSFAPASPITLNSTNWNTGIDVTVTAIDEDIDDDNQTRIIQTGTTVSSDAKYSGTFDPGDVTVTINDNDTAGVTVNPTTLTISEPSGSASFNIKLNSEPTDDVTISLTQSAAGECSFSPASPITLNSANWNTGIDVIVTTIDDGVADGSQTRTVQTGTTASTSDAKYNGTINPSDVTITINDDDSPGVTISKTSVAVTEGGATDSYTVQLNTVPTAPVTISFNTGTQINPISLPAFTDKTPQSVTVSAVNDTTAEGTHSATITHSASSSDTAYSGIAIPSVTATITDNDAQTQSIVFNLGNKAYGDSSFVGATATPSNYTVTLTSSSNTDVATVSGNRVYITGIGSTTICGKVAGDKYYTPATGCGTLTVSKKTLTVTADNKTRPYNSDNPPFTISYSGWVGSDNPSVLDTPPTVSCSATKTSNAGTYPIAVSGASDNNYSFSYVSGTLTITKLSQSISGFESLPTLVNHGETITLNATATSGLPVIFTSKDPAIVSVSGNKLTPVGYGNASICATQPGNVNYNPAQEVCQTVTVNSPPVIDEGKSVSVTMDEDGTPTAFGLVLHAGDPDGSADSIRWEISKQASHGRASTSGTGSVKGIGYSPDKDWNGRDSFEVKAFDDRGGATTITVTVTVRGVNDAPVLDVSKSPALSSIEEDIAPSANKGNTVAEILSDNPITDPDGTAVKAIAVTAVDNSHGYWQYSTNSGSTWNDFTDVRGQEESFEDEARLLDSQHRIRFVPNPDYPGGDCNFLKDENGYFICPEGYAEFTFRAYDKTSGNPGVTADVTQSGGITAFSAFKDKAGISVEPVDDAPRLVNEIPDMEVPEDDSDLIINLRDVFTDPDNDDNLIEDSVEILAVRNVGPDSGSPLLFAEITGTRLEISYAANQYGEADIEVWAESNGKTVSDTFTIIVHSLLDPPVIPIHQFPVMSPIDEDNFNSPGDSVDGLLTGIFVTKNGYTYLDCETYASGCVKYKGFITDPDAPNTEPVRAIAVIAVNNTFGKWQYSLDGTTWNDFSPTAGKYVFMDKAARILETTHRIRFVPNPDYYGEAAFVFRAWDQSDDSVAGETADISNLDTATAFSEIMDYGTIRVEPVDDMPQVVAPIGDVVVNKNADTMEIDLSNIFTDSDSNPAAISKYVRHNSDPTLLTATVTGENTLTLDFAENRHGTAIIELIAQSGGEEIHYSFTVVITEEDSEDPPVIEDPRYPGFTAIDEDEFDNEGNTVAEVIKETALTDSDGEPVEAIVVTAVNNDFGIWQYADGESEDGEWQNFTEKPGDFIDLKDEARLLDKTYRIRFVPEPDYFGESSIKFRPWDQQTGVAGQTVTTLAKDSSMDSEAATNAGIRVNEIDDPPMVANPIGYIAVKEATTPKVIDLTNVFTDIDSDPRKITKSLESNSNEDVVIAEVEGNKLTLEFDSKNRGTAIIKIRGESEGQSVSDTFIVTINNAPELDATQSAGLTDIEEDEFDSPGDLVADILAEKAITDADGSPKKAIAVTAVDNTDGFWQYSIDDGKTWENFTLKTGVVSFESRARLLGGTDRIRFVPDADYFGYSVFIFRAWDMSIGETGNAMALERVGGSEPFSSATDEAGIRILSVDDPLVQTGFIDNVAVDENADDVIIDLSDVFSDPDDPPESLLKTVESNTNPDLVSAKIEGNTLTLSFAEGGYGTADITILAESNGQTVSESFNVVVKRTSNYAPILDTTQSPALVAIYENDADNFGNRVADIVVNGSIADIDVEGESVKAIAVIAADNANGIWQYSTDNGDNWYDISPVIGKFTDMETAALLLDGTLTGNDTHRIRFVPNPGFIGIASIRFRAWDKNQGEAGGLADASINGGQTSFSADWDEAMITVKAISPCNQSVEKGDINGDGTIDLSDLILALKAAAGISHRAVCVYGDVNGDGKIGLEEAVYILNAME